MIARIAGGGSLSCSVDISRGGRIVSLVSRAGSGPEVEWLAASTDTWPPEPGPDGAPAFVRDGMGGWDEVCPTIAPGTLADGTRLHDHGDAWSSGDWVIEDGDGDGDDRRGLAASVRLSTLPVTLRRSISATESGLRLQYSATTESERSLPFHWTAHPQFEATTDTTVELVESADAGAGAVSGQRARESAMPGSGGLIEEYPHPERRHDLSSANAPALQNLRPGTSLKVFVEPSATPTGAILHRPGVGSLEVNWQSACPLYLGLFWDRCQFASTPVIAIEPSTGLGDSAAEAERSNSIAWLSASAPLEWHIDLAVS